MKDRDDGQGMKVKEEGKRNVKGGDAVFIIHHSSFIVHHSARYPCIAAAMISAVPSITEPITIASAIF